MKPDRDHSFAIGGDGRVYEVCIEWSQVFFVRTDD